MDKFKNLRLVKVNREVKDPPRFPDVINGYENKSKADFKKSLQLEVNQLGIKLFGLIKD